MGRSVSLHIAYGIDLKTRGGDWRIQEKEDDYEYVLPWHEDIDEDEMDEDDASDETRICKFLLRRLPESPCGDELDELHSWSLNDLLKERTGLKLERFGYEYGDVFLCSGPKLTEYSHGPVDINQETLKVTEEQRKWLTWAMETLGVTFMDKPGVKVMGSYG